MNHPIPTLVLALALAPAVVSADSPIEGRAPASTAPHEAPGR
jgi:hypothetical protein